MLLSAVIEDLILSHFYRVSYRQNWEEELLQVETKHQINIHLRAINLTNPQLARTKSFADQRFNLSVVIDLAIIIETKAQLSQAQMVRKGSQTPLPCPTPLSQDVNSNQT